MSDDLKERLNDRQRLKYHPYWIKQLCDEAKGRIEELERERDEALAALRHIQVRPPSEARGIARATLNATAPAGSGQEQIIREAHDQLHRLVTTFVSDRDAAYQQTVDLMKRLRAHLGDDIATSADVIAHAAAINAHEAVRRPDTAASHAGCEDACEEARAEERERLDPYTEGYSDGYLEGFERGMRQAPEYWLETAARIAKRNGYLAVAAAIRQAGNDAK